MNTRAARLALAIGMLITLFIPWGSSLGYQLLWYAYVIFPAFAFFLQTPINLVAIPTFASVPIPIMFNLVLARWPKPNLLRLYRVALSVFTIGMVLTAIGYVESVAYGFWIYFALVCVACIMEAIIYWRERALRK